MAPVENVVPATPAGYPYSLSQAGTDAVVDLGANLASKESSGNALAGPLVWSGADFTSDQAYTLQLSKDEVVEIDNALANFKSLGLDGDDINQENFPLPTLARRLRGVAETLHLGRGFSVIRGLDSSKYSVEESVMLFLGISCYIAEKRGVQDRKGNMLSHITDSKQWTAPADKRHGIHTNAALGFHTDMGCDILSLQVRHSAHEGGNTYLSSAWTAFNDLLNREPEVVKTLMTPNWPVQISGRKQSYYLAPILTFHDGKLMTSCDPPRFGPHPSMTNSKIPTLTDTQRHALEVLAEAVHSAELQLKLQTGDFLYLNNLALFHRRDSYKDDDTSSRHMVRLWLRSQKFGWAIPDAIFPPWNAAYGEKSKKITNRVYSLVPMATYHEPKYSAVSAAFMLEDSEESSDDE